MKGSTSGELTTLCACGRMLHIPTNVVFVQAGRASTIAKVELDRGYLYAHTATWHQHDTAGDPAPDARLRAVS